MNITGIIAEYNPFHNGHMYHLDQARKITDCDLLIAVISGNYNQRGDLSIINKFKKTEAGLKHGVDLVVELPYIYTLQNAYVYGQKAVDILNNLKINNLVFGSETNNLEELPVIISLERSFRLMENIRHKKPPSIPREDCRNLHKLTQPTPECNEIRNWFRISRSVATIFIICKKTCLQNQVTNSFCLSCKTFITGIKGHGLVRHP